MRKEGSLTFARKNRRIEEDTRRSSELFEHQAPFVRHKKIAQVNGTNRFAGGIPQRNWPDAG